MFCVRARNSPFICIYVLVCVYSVTLGWSSSSYSAEIIILRIKGYTEHLFQLTDYSFGASFFFSEQSCQMASIYLFRT